MFKQNRMILKNSQGRPNKPESDRGAEFYNSTFQIILKVNTIHHSSRCTEEGPSISERVTRTLRNLLKKNQSFKQEMVLG